VEKVTRKLMEQESEKYLYNNTLCSPPFLNLHLSRDLSDEFFTNQNSTNSFLSFSFLQSHIQIHTYLHKYRSGRKKVRVKRRFCRHSFFFLFLPDKLRSRVWVHYFKNSVSERNGSEWRLHLSFCMHYLCVCAAWFALPQGKRRVRCGSLHS